MTTEKLSDEDRTLWLDAAMAELDRREQPAKFGEISAKVAAMKDGPLNALIAKLQTDQRQRDRRAISDMAGVLGSITSAKKAKSSAANGKKGGRPRKTQ